MNNKNIANEWLNFTDNDLNSAKFLMQMKLAPLEIIKGFITKKLDN